MRAKGFDHTTQGAYAVAAGVAKALRLDETQTANAIAIAGTSLNALRVTRTGALSHWKGLAYPSPRSAPSTPRSSPRAGSPARARCSRATRASCDSIAGPFEIDWEARGPRARPAHHPQALQRRDPLAVRDRGAARAARRHTTSTPAEVERVELDTFQVAYDIIGGGEEGDKTQIRTKEQADHSLPYLLAVALLDGQVLPEQFAPERIVRAGRAGAAAPRRGAPRPPSCPRASPPSTALPRAAASARRARCSQREQHDYEGFHTRPMSWDAVAAKFDRLAGRHVEPGCAPDQDAVDGSTSCGRRADAPARRRSRAVRRSRMTRRR